MSGVQNAVKFQMWIWIEIPDLLKQLRKKDSLSLQQIQAVGEIEKHHEERYRALLKNIETAKVFERVKLKYGNAVTADILW